MRYRVTFRKRFNEKGVGSDSPAEFLNLSDGVVQDALFVERFAPDSLHGEEHMEEDDDFLAFGSEVWEYDVAPGREDEFKFEVKNSQVAMECEEIEADPTA
ncbi:MAG: hypothetical protein M3Y07_11295 [Acidobacteriota bacterium]|nr:hypothetical protein [Acidobacteriota bacterium]